MYMYQTVDLVITPEEMAEALRPFKLFISNTHVPVGYGYTPTDDFLSGYKSLYDMLCRGEHIDSRRDHALLPHFSVTSDIDTVRYGRRHTYEGREYVLYEGTDRGIPPYIAPFALSVYTGDGKVYASTRASYMAEGAHIMGYQMAYPRLGKNEAASHGVESEKEWASYNDYMLFREHIMGITSALTIICGSVKKKTSVRISDNAKEAIPRFDCIQSYGLTVV